MARLIPGPQSLLWCFSVQLLRSGTMLKVCLKRGNKAMTFCGRVNFLQCVNISTADRKALLMVAPPL